MSSILHCICSKSLLVNYVSCSRFERKLPLFLVWMQASVYLQHCLVTVWTPIAPVPLKSFCVFFVFQVVRHLGIVGECNIQYALDPHSLDYCIIEVCRWWKNLTVIDEPLEGFGYCWLVCRLLTQRWLVNAVLLDTPSTIGTIGGFEFYLTELNYDRSKRYGHEVSPTRTWP